MRGGPVVLAVLCALPALAGLPGQTVVERKTKGDDFKFPVERIVTDNGLVVLLSADLTVNHVVIDMSYSAGAIYQGDQPGLAHLVEHAMATGDDPEVDYRSMLEARGATGFNAFTGFETMSFRVTVPPEELPLALWVSADRMGTLAGRLDEKVLARHRAIVLEEHLTSLDAPFNNSHLVMMARLFGEGHPLHFGILGTTKAVGAMTVDDVKKFAGRYLVPANGVLTVVGNFDLAAARELVKKTFARVPAGEHAPAPAPLRKLTASKKISVIETASRRPRVTLAWVLEPVLPETAAALSLGALVVRAYDGFLDMFVDCHFEQIGSGGIFILGVTMPGGLDTREAHDNTEVVLRFLTMALVPADVIASTAHALDRGLMSIAESPALLAGYLSRLEMHPLPIGMPPLSEHHWLLTPVKLQEFTDAALRGARLTIESKPTRPLPKRKSR